MDRSYLRLKNVVLSYDLPTFITQKVSLSNVRVYVSGSNLYTWTNYKGFDPERTRDAGSRGGIPQARIIKIGITVTL